MDGTFDFDVTVERGADQVLYELIAPDGTRTTQLEKVYGDGACWSGKIASPALWSAETPNLYTLTLTTMAKGRKIETARLDVGFRSVEYLSLAWVSSENQSVNSKYLLSSST